MFSRCLLLVLVGLQAFMTASQNANAPNRCCYKFQHYPIPSRIITAYELTGAVCTNPGVIFTLMSGRLICADPGVQWVKDSMKRIDRLFESIESY